MRKNWREEFSVPFKLDSADADSGVFQGVASVFGNLIDTWPLTRVQPGAFTKTLAENFKRIKILYQHDWTKPVGLPIELRETAEGLFTHGELGQSALAQSVRADLKPLPLTKRSILDELSIGFDPIREEYIKEEGQTEAVRLLKEVKLWEISIVTWGADSKARVRSAHALPFRDLPLAPEALLFERDAAIERVEKWAAGDAKKLAAAFITEGFQGPDSAALIADVVDGRLVAVPQAVYDAARTLSMFGAEDRDEDVQRHIERYYRKLGRVAPWDKRRSFLALSLEPFLSLPMEGHGLDALTEDDKKVIGEAVGVLQKALTDDKGAPPAKKPEEGEQAPPLDEVEGQLLEMELAVEGGSAGLI
jgi:HK97 family phage prohead protease